MANARHQHFDTMKRVFNYLRGTFEYLIFYHSDILGDPHLMDMVAYAGFDWGWDVNIRRSMNGYIF